MNYFRKKRLFSSKEGAESLLSHAHMPMKESDFSKLSVSAVESEEFKLLLVSTNEAIMAFLLRRMAVCCSPESREYEFVDSFEELAILNDVSDPSDPRFQRFTDLMIRVEMLDAIMRSNDEPTLRRAIPEWTRGWLETVWSDEDNIERTILIFGGHLCIYIHQQIVAFAETVKSALYERR